MNGIDMTIVSPEIWFFRPHGLIGRIVAWATHGEYSHCGFAHYVEGSPVFTDAHARYGIGCRAVEAREAPDLRVIFDCDQRWLNAQLATRWGRPYGYADALGFVLGGNRNHSGMICTELVIEVLREAIHSGIDVHHNGELQYLTTGRTSPDQLLRVLTSKN